MAISVQQPQRCTLYVGDLHEDATESDLHTMFCAYRCTDIRICRDRETKKSLRYGYVNFAFNQEAEFALSQLNHKFLKGQPMRIMWSNRNPYTRRAGVGNLFVKNLDPSIGPDNLEAVFSKYGTIISCKVVFDDSGKSKCFGFVQLDTQEEANNAINTLHNSPSTGLSKQLYVAHFVKKKIGEAPIKRNNLYVKNFDGDITNESLNEKFSEFGKVTSAIVMRDENSKSKRFGFVCFEKLENAEKALETMNGFKWGEKELYVAYAQKKAERTEFLKKKFAKTSDAFKFKGHGVYVKNLDQSVDDKTLEEFFAKCGNILYKKVVIDMNNKLSRGFGFVYFSSIDEATKAIKSINGTELKSKKILVVPVIPKDQLKRPSTNNNTNTRVNTNTNPSVNQSVPITTYAVPQPSYFVPNTYIPYTQQAQNGYNTYNVPGQQQVQSQNAWANYGYNYGYNYAPQYTTSTQPKPILQGYDHPYIQYNNLQQVSGMEGTSNWSISNGGKCGNGSWKNNMDYNNQNGVKAMGRNNHNNNNKKWMMNKAVGPRRSKGSVAVQTS